MRALPPFTFSPFYKDVLLLLLPRYSAGHHLFEMQRDVSSKPSGRKLGSKRSGNWAICDRTRMTKRSGTGVAAWYPVRHGKSMDQPPSPAWFGTGVAGPG